MRKKWLGLALGLLLPFLPAEASQGETVTEKVARTGFLTVGTRFDHVPYSYVDDQGQLVGYSIDVIKAIKTELQKRLGRDVTIQMVEALSPQQRMEMLENGDIDIACDLNFTWERDEYFDFSLSYGISGIRLLSKKGSNLGSAESLIGKRIGVIEGSVAAGVIKLLQPQAQVISGIASAETALAALQSGKIDAIAGDTLSLQGLAVKNDPNLWEISPKESLAQYGIACIVPENNSTFLDTANYAIVKMMQDYITENPETVAQINRWFGEEGVIPLPPDLLKGFFAFTIIERAQIPPEAPTPTNP